MKIQNGKDFWAGVMFMGVGAAFMFVARDYQMGSAVRMGPAYFPMVLGGLQIVLGAMIFMRGYFSKLSHTVWVFPFRPWFFFPGLVLGLFAFNAADWIKTLGSPGEVIQYIINAASLFLMFAAWGPRALFIILATVVAFGYLLKPIGLIPATFVLIFGSAWGGHEFKFKEVLIMTVVLAIFSVLAFVKGLGLPMNLWPEWY